MKRTNAEISKGNNDIMEKHRRRRRQSHQTPNNPIRHFLQADREVSRRRRMKGKLKEPNPIRIHGDKILGRNDPRKRPSNPLPRTLQKKQKVWDAALESDEKTAVDSLLNLRKGTRKKRKKKGTKRTKKKGTKRKRKKKRKKK